MGVAGSFEARVGPIAHHSQRDEIATDCRIDLMSDHWPLLVAEPLDGERLVNSQLRPRAGQAQLVGTITVRHCSIAGPKVTWPKPKPPSTG
jgi:hypothetical protein